MMRRGAVLCCAVLLGGTSAAACAQVVVGDATDCPACSIEVRSLFAIGALDGPGSFERQPAFVTHDARGRYWTSGNDSPSLFSATGQYLGTVGGVGDGPGELRRPFYPHGLPGDSVLVLSPGRATIYAPDGRFARHLTLTGSFRFVSVLHWPDSVLLGGTISSSEHFGYPLHLVSMVGRTPTVLRSGGDDHAPLGVAPYTLVGTEPDQLWGVRFGTYTLERWNRRLERIAIVRRSPRWWARTDDPHGAPTNFVQAAAVDERGLLWVAVTVPAANWRQGIGAVKDEFGHRTREDPTAMYATRIEVIDVHRGVLLATRSLDFFVVSLLPGRRAAAAITAPEGQPQLRFFSLQLNGH
jgi:hypothetical protein